MFAQLVSLAHAKTSADFRKIKAIVINIFILKIDQMGNVIDVTHINRTTENNQLDSAALQSFFFAFLAHKDQDPAANNTS